jgi:hypothetical protein
MARVEVGERLLDQALSRPGSKLRSQYRSWADTLPFYPQQQPMSSRGIGSSVERFVARSPNRTPGDAYSSLYGDALFDGHTLADRAQYGPSGPQSRLGESPWEYEGGATVNGRESWWGELPNRREPADTLTDKLLLPVDRYVEQPSNLPERVEGREETSLNARAVRIINLLSEVLARIESAIPWILFILFLVLLAFNVRVFSRYSLVPIPST